MQKETLLETIYLEREQGELANRSEYEKEVVKKLKEMATKINLENSLIQKSITRNCVKKLTI